MATNVWMWVYYPWIMYNATYNTFVHIDLSTFALHKSLIKISDPHETRNASDPWCFPLCCNQSLLLPTFFLPCVFRLDFDAFLQRVPGNVESADLKPDWDEFLWLTSRLHTSSQSFKWNSRMCFPLPQSNETCTAWAPYFPTAFTFDLYTQDSIQLHTVFQRCVSIHSCNSNNCLIVVRFLSAYD